MSAAYYPIYLDLRGRNALIVGGGPIATGKAQGLIDAGARVTVVAPEVSGAIQTWCAAGALVWRARAFDEADLDGQFIVIAATDDRALNARVYQLASAQQRVANAVDDLDNCNFIAPAIARRGPLQVAISTGGASPALAKQLRDRIEQDLLTDGAAELAEFLGRWRPAVKAALPTYQRRQTFWEDVLASCLPGLLNTAGAARADDALRACLSIAADAGDTGGAGARCAAYPERPAACRACRGA